MLEKKYYDGFQVHRILNEVLNDSETILRILQKFSEEPSAQQWIPCSERLPTEGVNVLVTTPWKQIFIAWLDYDDGEWITYEVNDKKIIAWMPLPEPYKEEQK